MRSSKTTQLPDRIFSTPMPNMGEFQLLWFKFFLAPLAFGAAERFHARYKIQARRYRQRHISREIREMRRREELSERLLNAANETRHPYLTPFGLWSSCGIWGSVGVGGVSAGNITFFSGAESSFRGRCLSPFGGRGCSGVVKNHGGNRFMWTTANASPLLYYL